MIWLADHSDRKCLWLKASNTVFIKELPSYLPEKCLGPPVYVGRHCSQGLVTKTKHITMKSPHILQLTNCCCNSFSIQLSPNGNYNPEYPHDEGRDRFDRKASHTVVKWSHQTNVLLILGWWPTLMSLMALDSLSSSVSLQMPWTSSNWNLDTRTKESCLDWQNSFKFKIQVIRDTTVR